MIGVIGVIMGISIGVLWANLFFFLETPYGDNSVSLRFEKGTSVNEILKKLEANQVISNISFFKAYLWFTHTGPNLRAGEYIFPPRQTPREVLSRLLKGDFSTHKITIPEGWTARQIAIHLASLELVDPQAFLLKCIDQNFIKSLGLSVPTLEGYLYPDTYEIYKPKDEEEVIRKMVERFKEVYIKNFAGQESHVGLPIESVITLASIVEKETGNAAERPIVASVFLNRIRKNMPLASDPTIIYSIPDFNGNLTRADLERPGPYNSYLNVGLPPTPICNPGKEAIQAVINPLQTNYLFFVAKGDGTHQFSETEDQHFAAVRKYQLGK